METKFSGAFAKAEEKGGCLTTGDATAVEIRVDAATTSLQSALQAGVRFVDNGDGTISDLETGLMWEKKSTDGGIHDVENGFDWSATLSAPHPPDGDVFTVFLATLNGGTGPNTCFAGHCDWRLPTVLELQGLHDPASEEQPEIDPVFKQPCTPGCSVTSCSCTVSFSEYRSAVTHGPDPSMALGFDFDGGFADPDAKYGTNLAARAVRGGSGGGSSPTLAWSRCGTASPRSARR